VDVYELTLKVFLLKDINNEDALERISQLIDKTLSRNDKFCTFHHDNKFKNYSFNSFYPIEKGKVYHEGKLYSIKIRTIDEEIVDFFRTNLVNEYTDYIKALTIEHNIINKKLIEKIYSITPIIIKTDNGYWKQSLTLGEFEKRIKENLIKKYNLFCNEKLSEDFELFQIIKFENKVPISCKYKDIHILGDKVTIVFAQNETAQTLAYLALGTGIGEMNARGYGFVNYRWI